MSAVRRECVVRKRTGFKFTNSNNSPYFNNNYEKKETSDERKDTEVDCNVINRKLDFCFFNVSCIDLARTLLGKILCRQLDNGEILKGKVVETESYVGREDKASYSFKGKQTNRNEAMFMKPGTAYVYSIYGMYYCFNISSKGEGAAVLIRSVEPLVGLQTMNLFRNSRRQTEKCWKDKELCNGPSKLCQAFNIQKALLNKEDLTVSNLLWLEQGHDICDSDIIKCKRIGIDSYGEEWANKPLRFYIKDNSFVSIRDKKAEIQHD